MTVELGAIGETLQHLPKEVANATVKRALTAAHKLLVHDMAEAEREQLNPCIEAIHLRDALETLYVLYCELCR